MRAAEILLATVGIVSLGCCVSSQVEECPPYDVLEKIVYLPLPHDCSSFRRCQTGQPILGHCPPGKHFSPSTSTCKDPAKAGCQLAEPEPDPCSATSKDSCAYECSCSKKQDNSTCPNKLQFSPTLEVFDKAGDSCPKEAGDFELSGGKVGHLVTSNVTGNAFSCPANQTDEMTFSVPHFADCSKMVVCGANGSEQVHECPPGQVYNPEFGLCDAPEFVECSSPPRNDTPTSANTTSGGGCKLGAALANCEQECRCSLVQGACPSTISFSASMKLFQPGEPPACSQEPGAVELGGGLVAVLSVVPNTTSASRCPPGATGRVYLPDPADCGRVTVCTGGKERTLTCPRGLAFNPRTRMCGPRDPAVCGGTPPPAASTTAAPVTAAPAENDTLVYDDLPCPTSFACAAGRNSSVPHLSDCTVFCRCGGGGGPFLGACPPGLHFSARAQTCLKPSKANCHSTCPQISVNERGRWEPALCTEQDSQEGVECSLTCDSGFQLIGSEHINCTSRGWYGSGGLNHIPSCNSPEELATAVSQKLNETLTQLSAEKMGIMFLLDESLSVDPNFFYDGQSPNFQAQKDLAGCLVRGFPLSVNRSAGVITFSTEAAVDVGLAQTSTCDFVSQLGQVTFFGGNTDLAQALSLAAAEINATSPPRKTLVLIVTDGQSQTDPAPVAASLKDAGHVLFAMAVGLYDRAQLEPISSTHTDGSKLFFALQDFELFQRVEYYLRDKYNQSPAQQCP